MKKKTVKAWAVIDAAGNTLNVGTRIDAGVFRGLYMIGSENEYLEEQWQLFKVVPCTITYEMPIAKKEKV